VTTAVATTCSVVLLLLGMTILGLPCARGLGGALRDLRTRRRSARLLPRDWWAEFEKALDAYTRTVAARARDDEWRDD